MAIRVRSTDGVNTDDGSTWPLAKLDMVGATTADVAGDTFYLSQAHAESTASAITLEFAGTIAAPSKAWCVNDSSETPTVQAETATISSTSNITVRGNVHFRGTTFNVGTGGTAAQSFLAATTVATNNQLYERCAIRLAATGTGLALVQLGDETRSDAHRIQLQDTTVRFGGVNHKFKLSCNFRWNGGSFESGGASPVNVFSNGLRGIGEFEVTNVNFNNIGTTFNLMQMLTTGNAYKAVFNKIALPSGWTGGLWSAQPTVPGMRAEIYNSWIGTTKLRYWGWDALGQARDSATVYRNGGFTDDGVPISQKFVTSADAEFPVMGLEGLALSHNVDAAGEITLTVEFAHEAQGSGTGGALRTDEIGFKISGPGVSTTTLKTNYLIDGTDYASSAEAWTGLTSPVRQKATFTISPTSEGEIKITPYVFAPGKTVYVCWKVGT